MSITLASPDLLRLADASRLLLSPLDHGSADEWRSAVNGSLRELLHADSAGFLLPVPEGLAMYSDEHDPRALAAYPELVPPPTPDGTPIHARSVQVQVDTLENMYGRGYSAYLGSAYYNEFAGVNGAHDTLAACIPLSSAYPIGMASLQFWHARPDGRRFGEREVALLRLLFPAFRAGVETHLRWSEQRADLLGSLDQAGCAALACDLAGKLLHTTAALETLLQAEPQAERIRGEILSVAEDLRREADAFFRTWGERPNSLVRNIVTSAGTSRVSGCLYGGQVHAGRAYVVVAVEPLGPLRRSADQLRAAYGLTPAEVRVALLIADGKSNDEIARLAFISPHTARRHTERVFSKLGVSSRFHVGPRLNR